MNFIPLPFSLLCSDALMGLLAFIVVLSLGWPLSPLAQCPGVTVSMPAVALTGVPRQRNATALRGRMRTGIGAQSLLAHLFSHRHTPFRPHSTGPRTHVATICPTSLLVLVSVAYASAGLEGVGLAPDQVIAWAGTPEHRPSIPVWEVQKWVWEPLGTPPPPEVTVLLCHPKPAGVPTSIPVALRWGLQCFRPPPANWSDVVLSGEVAEAETGAVLYRVLSRAFVFQMPAGTGCTMAGGGGNRRSIFVLKHSSSNLLERL